MPQTRNKEIDGLPFKDLEARLCQDLPGPQAHRLMAPLADLEKRFGARTDNAIHSAVLILLYPDAGGQLRIPFIRRASGNTVHSGQISLPGGRTEPTDTTYQATALRETHEEIGVAPSQIRVIGALSELYIPVSNYLVFPFVGYATQPPTFSASPDEVAALLPLRLHGFLHPSARAQATFPARCGTIGAPCFLVQDEKIWGATAMILSEFLEVWQETSLG